MEQDNVKRHRRDSMHRRRQRLESRNMEGFQKLGEARKDPSLQISEAAWPCRHLDSSQQTVRQGTLALSQKYVVLGTLLGQP